MHVPRHRLRRVFVACAAVVLVVQAVSAADFLETDDWPMADAQAAFADKLGDAMVHDITIDGDSVTLTADHPDDPERTTDYSWQGRKVQAGISMPNFSTLGMGDTKPFPLTDLPFDRLPQVKAAARDAMALPEAEITEIEGTMPTTRTSKKLIPLWEVHFTQPGGEAGSVFLTANGQVVDVIRPQSQQAELGPWLAPATVESTLARLAEEFGPNARYAEIFIDDTKAIVQMEDPQNPGKIAEIYVDADSMTRGESIMAGTPLGPTLDRPFTMADLAALDADMLADLEQRTIERMGMEGMTVFRYTIGRSILFMTPEDDRLVIEVRAGLDDGWTSGRAAYTLDATEVDAVLP